MTKIKICGLTREEDIIYSNELLPDYVGFVFAKSKRQIDFDKAAKLKGMLNQNIRSVGVFVNAPLDDIILLCLNKTIDLIQLHGEENEEYIRNLSDLVPNQIIKVVRIKEKKDLLHISASNIPYLLLDAFKEGEYGGCGISFDWSLAQNVTKPFFLAGGLNPNNIEEAIAKVNPYAVDVSSGVETNGTKDYNKMKDFVRKVRSV